MIPVTHAPVSLFGASLDPVASATGHMQSVTHLDPSLNLGLNPGVSSPASSTSPAPFANLLTEAVGQVESLEQQSKAATEGLLSGKGVDVHEAMIAAQKAGMGFELMLSVRNKALAAYQQVLGMQF